MPHHSRLSTFVLDCQVDDLAPHLEFWSKALGKPVAKADEDGDGRYAVLETDTDEPILLLQKVGHDSRIHLDIETDDIDAEVARLEELGAKKVEFCKRWWVMEAPSGHRFCVVRQQREPFGPHLNAWALGVRSCGPKAVAAMAAPPGCCRSKQRPLRAVSPLRNTRFPSTTSCVVRRDGAPAPARLPAPAR